MFELVRLAQATLFAAFRSRWRLVVENLLVRQQLQVALRSQRLPHLRSRDKLFWLLIRRLHRDWQRRLLLVRPETVLSWHRRGWRLFWRVIRWERVAGASTTAIGAFSEDLQG